MGVVDTELEDKALGDFPKSDFEDFPELFALDDLVDNWWTGILGFLDAFENEWDIVDVVGGLDKTLPPDDSP